MNLNDSVHSDPSGLVAMLLSNAYRPDVRVLKEATSLAEAGYQVTIIAWDRQGELTAEESLASGAKVVRVQDVLSGYGIGVGQLGPLFRFWGRAIRILDRLKPDIVHCHDFDTLPAGLWWGKRHRRPVIYDAHEYYADLVKPRLKGVLGGVLYRVMAASERIGARMSSGVITVDETLGDRYRKLNDRVVIIGHYPRRALAAAPNRVLSHPEVRLLYLGRLSVDRGLLVYAGVLRRLLALGVPARLFLAGPFTPESERDRFVAASRDVQDHVDLLGYVAYDKVPDLLRSADVGLALLQPEPRYVAAVAVKLFEYMAGGLPVVASNFPSMAGVIKGSGCGALVRADDEATAVEVISQWWREPELARTLGERGRQAVLTEYNWERLAGNLTDLYDEILVRA